MTPVLFGNPLENEWCAIAEEAIRNVGKHNDRVTVLNNFGNPDVKPEHPYKPFA